ncbi:FxLD family lantipeptide [Amycolatopsis sp. RM579]|uniref:FxLD family lantipeptide n=1 Tax=Amycolatopsis pithecellobii TaxID=664692 RepID=A0A6N7YZ20_9PSEU|nr:FxLD family lantipeptide [Amycolatopsis pithecellobii]
MTGKGRGVISVTAALIEVPAVFELDVQVETDRVRPEAMACQTDDGCGSTCEISACHSQK